MVQRYDHDVVVIGSGFGGSVAALRLAEKGYRVHVYEAGRRFEDEDFARTNWDLRRYLWAPRLGCYGIQRVHHLPHCLVLAGAGSSCTGSFASSGLFSEVVFRTGVLGRAGDSTGFVEEELETTQAIPAEVRAMASAIAMTASSTCAVQMLDVAFSRRMCCSRVCSERR